MIKFVLTTTVLLLSIKCGDSMLAELANFQPNTAPVLQQLVIKDSQKNLYTPGPEILPGMIFFLELTIAEKEGNIITIKFDSEMGGSSHKLIFNNLQIDDNDEKTLLVTATMVTPDSLPLEQDIYFSVTLTDAKEAELNYRYYLGPVKRKPIITEVEASTGSSPITIKWQADSDGFYQRYLVNNAATECTIVTDNHLVFSYTKEDTVTSQLSYTGSDKKLCIVVFDALNQIDVLEYNL